MLSCTAVARTRPRPFAAMKVVLTLQGMQGLHIALQPTAWSEGLWQHYVCFSIKRTCTCLLAGMVLSVPLLKNAGPMAVWQIWCSSVYIGVRADSYYTIARQPKAFSTKMSGTCATLHQPSMHVWIVCELFI